jgi:hypothetical protein
MMKEHSIRDATRPAPPSDIAEAGPAAPSPDAGAPVQKPGEIGGRDGPEPTRYGDWEVNGRCSDF